jgi:hypothetical protein
MKQFAIIVLAAVLQPALAVAADKSTGSKPKPSSFVPHAHINSHIYGTPIQPAIVSRSKTSHHKPKPKNPSSHPRK